ncbi:MAG: hypothetical protein K0Q85_1634 [Caproiciproducens sp.]|nr:hypothetical protein [Caproiciproducens sp.]
MQIIKNVHMPTIVVVQLKTMHSNSSIAETMKKIIWLIILMFLKFLSSFYYTILQLKGVNL